MAAAIDMSGSITYDQFGLPQLDDYACIRCGHGEEDHFWPEEGDPKWYADVQGKCMIRGCDCPQFR